MPLFVITYPITDHCLYFNQGTAIAEAQSSDDIFLAIDAYYTTQTQRIAKSVARAKVLHEKYAIGQKDISLFYKKSAEENVSFTPSSIPFVFQEQNLSCVLTSTSQEDFWDDLIIETMDDWVARKRQETRTKM